LLKEPFEHFDWDEGNITKNQAKHGVGQAEIEALFKRGLRWFKDPRHSGTEPRFLGLGRDAEGRPMLAAFTFRFTDGEEKVRPISVRYMHAKEVRSYETRG
jgi:uncharacterized protein